MSIEAMKQWLDALETYKSFIDDAHIIDGQWDWLDGLKEVADSLRQAIAEAEKVEPVAFALFRNGEIDWGEESLFSNEYFGVMFDDEECKPLYTTPQPRKPLTDEQIQHLVHIHIGKPNPKYPLDNSDWMHFARAIEAAHGIKE